MAALTLNKYRTTWNTYCTTLFYEHQWEINSPVFLVLFHKTGELKVWASKATRKLVSINPFMSLFLVRKVKNQITELPDTGFCHKILFIGLVIPLLFCYGFLKNKYINKLVLSAILLYLPVPEIKAMLCTIKPMPNSSKTSKNCLLKSMRDHSTAKSKRFQS